MLTHRTLNVLLAAALLVTMTVALTGGDRADAVDGPVDIVYVATGRNFPDALAGSTLATSSNAPLLTVEKELPLPAATIEALTTLQPGSIVVFGGPGAVSADVFEALTDYTTGAVVRVAGNDRHETAAAIAEALPDKVADADLLDGLDATDFARADHAHSTTRRWVHETVTGTITAESEDSVTADVAALTIDMPTDGVVIVTMSAELSNNVEEFMGGWIALRVDGALSRITRESLTLDPAAGSSSGTASRTFPVELSAGSHELLLQVRSYGPGIYNGEHELVYSADLQVVHDPAMQLTPAD